MHVLEDWFFAEIEANHFRHIWVKGFVVGHTSTHCVRQRHPTSAVGVHQAGHAEHGVRSERERINEVVIDTPINDIDFLRPLRGAHENGVVLNKQVDALNQLYPHLLCEERMFKVSRVEVSRRHQDDSRVVDTNGCGVAQGLEKHVWIVIDRANLLRRE